MSKRTIAKPRVNYLMRLSERAAEQRQREVVKGQMSLRANRPTARCGSHDCSRSEKTWYIKDEEFN